MLKDMPCGKVKVTDYEDPVEAAQLKRNAVLTDKLFGFVRCKLATPDKLWTKFGEIPPMFMNRAVPEPAAP